MSDLRKRFGRLLAAHRRRRGFTQEALAEAADVSPDTIAKIEIGATGARFPVPSCSPLRFRAAQSGAERSQKFQRA
jgi:transcriptional regulator with XRE-family HTH domain